MNENKMLFWGILAFGVGSIIWYSKNHKKEEASEKKTSDSKMMNADGKKCYTNAFLKQYDVVMPPNQASESVKAEAFAMQDERKAKEQARMEAKKPVYI